MFGIYESNGPVFRGRLESAPAVRAVVRRRPVEAIARPAMNSARSRKTAAGHGPDRDLRLSPHGPYR